uniref:Nuclear pore complex protein n=1 Tax=Strigamia maritima TaxID=126957 RepID=T1IIX7_STRMM
MDINSRTPTVRKEVLSPISILDDALSPISMRSMFKKTPRFTGTHVSFMGSSINSPVMSPQVEKYQNVTPIKHLSFEQSFNESVKSGPEVYSNVSSMWDDTDPGLRISENLFKDFLEAYNTYPAENQLFDLIEKYVSLCDNQVTLLQQTIKSAAVPSQNRTKLLYHMEQNERNTWQLINALYRDRLQNHSDPDQLMIDLVGKRLSDKEIVSHLYERDSSIRQNQLIIDWLEKTSAAKLDSEHFDKVEYFSENSVTWENTLNQLKLNRPKGLEDELRLFKHLLCFIRGGRLDEAQRLCIKFGQPWRAASLEGWRLYHDPNYTTSTGNTIMEAEGNVSRDVWKCVCWNMSVDERIHPIERALYGVLSGNLRSLLPFCISWDDYVWAYFRVMVDMKVEQEIRSNSVKEWDESFESLPASYWDSNLTPASVFYELSSSPNRSIQAEAKQQFQVIQKFIILDDIDGLLAEMHEWARNDATLSGHMLRFFAHLVLFFRSIGRVSKEEYANVLLEAYVKCLIDTRRIRLVASYNATLPQLLQVHWYAKFLEGISDRTERQLCLELAENVGLDVAVITKLVVENIRNRTSDDGQITSQSVPGSRNIFESVAQDLQRHSTKEDLEKIDAVDWLMFDPSHRLEALKQANTFMRIFLASKKIDAVRAIFTKIPLDSIKVIGQQWQIQAGSLELPADYDNACREYLCFNAYLQAIDSFADWFGHFHHGRPEAPRLAQGASFTERVAYEHQHKQHVAELDRWQHALDLQTKVVPNKNYMTVDRLYNVLLFVDGGWMVDRRNDGPTDESRELQLNRLRELYLPEICLLVHAVLHATNQHRSCLQLVDVIASEEHKLFAVFRKEDLQELLDKMRDSSLVLLDRNLDPLGYLIK